SSKNADILEETNRELVPGEDFPTYFPPTFNFAAYVNKSETLQKFVELGVDLSKIEKKKGLPQFLMRLDFNRDVRNHLLLLHDLEIPAELYGEFLTKNPLFFKNSIEDLETRIYYLRSKNFSIEQVRTIVSKDPFWLNFSTKRIDRRLGWFQKNFALTGDDVRYLATKFPRVITSHLMTVRELSFSIKEEMGFNKEETKALILAVPKVLMMNKDSLNERFNYVHNIMKFSHDKILQNPQILNTRLSRIENRHKFLKLLKRDQFDEKLPRYVSLKDIYSGSDDEFVTQVCESTIETYDNFLKTL
ncbi:transcription termination factor 3, mitochondrial, partial [Chironomus tepperi]|uniref:transcription termination factor 3, mitochondrial n=1 Tax=Chironomus tepperi TaxID=113505 RepID=UPI00391F8E8B